MAGLVLYPNSNGALGTAVAARGAAAGPSFKGGNRREATIAESASMPGGEGSSPRTLDNTPKHTMHPATRTRRDQRLDGLQPGTAAFIHDASLCFVRVRIGDAGSGPRDCQNPRESSACWRPRSSGDRRHDWRDRRNPHHAFNRIDRYIPYNE